MNLKLIKLSKENKAQCIEMIEEWKYDQQVNHTDGSPWAIFKNDVHDFDYYLDNLDYTNSDNGHVPTTTLFLLDIERNKLIGAVNIRHSLNERLLHCGGHIGDGIRPSERRKGYGTELIRLSLLECKKIGIKKVLICCNKNNIASQKAIIRNGGVLENEVIENNEIYQRYWIDNQ